MSLAPFAELELSYLNKNWLNYLATKFNSKLFNYFLWHTNKPKNWFQSYSFVKKRLNWLGAVSDVKVNRVKEMYLLDYWLQLKPSKRSVVMPWSFFGFNDIWRFGIRPFQYALTDDKLYETKVRPYDLSAFSYVDRYGAQFARREEFFKFFLNESDFYFKFNKLVARGLNIICF